MSITSSIFDPKPLSIWDQPVIEFKAKVVKKIKPEKPLKPLEVWNQPVINFTVKFKRNNKKEYESDYDEDWWDKMD
jgi:hypothetical protein